MTEYSSRNEVSFSAKEIKIVEFQKGKYNINIEVDEREFETLFKSFSPEINIKKIPTVKLSKREIEILKLISQGKKNAEIAKEIKISIHTVKAHVANILQKLKVKYRLQAAIKAVSEKIIDI